MVQRGSTSPGRTAPRIYEGSHRPRDQLRHALMQNLRRGRCELGVEGRPHRLVAAAFTDRARVHLTAVSQSAGSAAA